MSEMAKQARAAMKAKASKLTTADPYQKVDSSTWTPPDALNTEAKTGLRPVSRRAFKKGGKVMGEKAKANLGRKPRKSGGEATQYAIAKINRNVKDANEERPGIKHIGALKTGGAAKRKGREDGGVAVKKIAMGVSGLNPEDKAKWDKSQKSPYTGSSYEKPEKFKPMPETTEELTGNLSFKKGGKAKRKGRATGGYLASADFGDQNAVPNPRRTAEDEEISPAMAARMRGIMDRDAADSRRYEEDMEAKRLLGIRGYKRGGATKKAMGGPMAGSKKMMSDAQNVAGVPASVLNSAPAQSRFSKQMGLKKGGAAKHDDAKQDMALIKKMIKPAAMRKGRDDGGRSPTYRQDQVSEMLKNDDFDASKMSALERISKGAKIAGKAMIEPIARGGAYVMDQMGYKKGGKAKRTARKEGGGVFTGPGYPGKIPGVTGGRIARATGGKTKGKTNINIMIAAGKPAGQDMMGPPPGMGKPPGGLPIPVPPGAGAGGPPMPMPMPVAAPAPMPAPMPTPRKSGGRLTKVASSYKDMTAGSAGGEGRLQKTDIAKKHKDAPAFKKGGKVYRSYKDMDAGSGSGFGRLEKAEIQKGKR
jgi:hypothetical protein